ncbi:hypothetical protein Zmor_027595 [Zophobas morio]|uniref:Partial AB-hydrolase lipase domain-containing protein n=1 Tax=Zophobas morio TaxID=2755281 RepID=A0AA38HQW8_9CUCU|nr:hypothetical protein Zmor_027595 [Zophobas morio]
MWVLLLQTVLGFYLYPVSANIEDVHLTISQILTKYGYPSEVHYVTTSDGYILALHRIPHGKNSTTSNKPVLVLHGIFFSSKHYVVVEVEHDLGYVLADQGYDVWLGDNHHKRAHTWLPQGTYFLHRYVHPSRYNAKVKATWVGTWRLSLKANPLRALAPWNVVLNTFLKVFNTDEIPPPSFTIPKTVTCRVSPFVCNQLLISMFGYKRSGVNSTTFKIFLQTAPVPISRKQGIHVFQLMKSGYFRRYDFGRNNVKVYGTSTPPAFNLSSVTAKNHLFYSDNDNIVTNVEIDRLCEELGGACTEKRLISEGTITHMDWVFGTGVRGLVYSKLVNVLANY